MDKVVSRLGSRAQFVYDAARLAAEAAGAPIIPKPWEEREDDFKDQFLLAFVEDCRTLRGPYWVATRTL